VCVCVRARACVLACLRARVCASMQACSCAQVRACSRQANTQETRAMHACVHVPSVPPPGGAQAGAEGPVADVGLWHTPPSCSGSCSCCCCAVVLGRAMVRGPLAIKAASKGFDHVRETLALDHTVSTHIDEQKSTSRWGRLEIETYKVAR